MRSVFLFAALHPVATLLSIALPAEAADAWAAEFMLGYRELSEEFGVTLAGGDTTRSLSGLTINVTAIGRAADAHLKRRSDARPGPLQGTEKQFIFMADSWRPESLADSRYIWLPVRFDEKGIPFIEWVDRWKPN